MQKTAVVQGGFLAACIVDAAVAAVLAEDGSLTEAAVRVVECKVTYLLPGRIGALECAVSIRRLGGRVGFAEVYALSVLPGSAVNAAV